MSTVAAVVVTYNRKTLLIQCLDSLFDQARSPERIVIVDNGSTDGTSEYLSSKGYLSRTDINYLRLDTNTGGAGGFSRGLESACELGAEWIWLMDDDAIPQRDALGALMDAAFSEAFVYSSLAIADTDPGNQMLCWPARQVRDGLPNRPIFSTDQLEPLTEVEDLPFLGFLIHRSLVARIGLPDSAFFISNDDLDYSLRARYAGAKLLVVKSSLISHPGPSRRVVRLPWRAIGIVDFPAWRRYYEVRNRIVVARRHHGLKLWTHTLPGTFVRWIVGMLFGRDRLRQSKAYLKGTIDGLRGRLGVVWKPGEP